MSKSKIVNLLVFSLLPFFTAVNWFQGWNYIHQIDAWFKINPEKQLYDVLFLWKDRVGLGYASSDFHTILFFIWQTGFLKFFETFLSSWQALVLSQFIIYYLTLVLGMSSAYLFFKEFYYAFFALDEGNGREEIILYSLSFLYSFNLYTLIYVFYRYTAWTILWASLPLFSYTLLKYLRSGLIKYVIYLGAITLLTPLGGVFSAGVVLQLFMTCALIWILAILFNPKSAICYSLRFLIFIVIIVSLNFWALIPQIMMMRSATETAQLSIVNDLKALEYASQFTSILNILRFLGYYVLYGAKFSYEYFPYSWIELLENKSFQALTFIYPLIIGSALVIMLTEKQRSIKRLYLAAFSVLLGLIIIMKGINEPFREIGYWLLNLNSVFFRHPYDRFVHIFNFLFFIVFLYLLYRCSKSIKGFKQFVSLTLIFVIIVLSTSYPIFNGSVVHFSDRLFLPSSSYWALREKISVPSIDEYRILVMPFVLDWGEYTYNISGKIHHPNRPITYYLIPETRVLQHPTSPQSNKFLYTLYYAMKLEKYEEFINIIRNMNIQYILFHKDATDKLIISSKNREIIKLTPAFIKVLVEKKMISKVFEDESIVLYEISVAAEKMLFICRLSPAIEDSDLPLKFPCNCSITSVEGEEPAKIISYERINPTLWRIQINSSDPFLLFFAQSFDPLWKAKIYKHGNIVGEVNSKLICGIANGFLINQTGLLEVIIEYEPQKWFYIGLMMTTLTLIACTIIYLVHDWAKEKGILGLVKRRLKPA